MTKLSENNNDLFNDDTFWSPEEEAKASKQRSRVTAIRRAIREAEKAIKAAEAVGNTQWASALQNRINEFQDLINGLSGESDSSGSNSSKDSSDNSNAESSASAENASDSSDEADSSDNSNNSDTSGKAEQNTDDASDRDDSSSDGEFDDEEINNIESEEGQSESESENDDKDDLDNSNKDSVKSEKTDETEEAEEDSEENSKEDSDENTSSSDDSDKSNDEGDSDNDSEGDGDDDSTSVDPFTTDVDATPKQGKPQKPQEPSLKDIIKQLKKTSGEGRKGVNQALKDILTARGIDVDDFLGEALISLPKKQLYDWTDDEFNNAYDNFLDEISEYRKLDLEDSDAQQERVKKIQQDLSNPIVKKGLQQEDTIEVNKDYQARRAREKEKQRYMGGNVKSFDAFKLNFWRAIKDQVDEVEQAEDTYFQINQQYEGEGVIKKGTWNVDQPSFEKPIVNLYFDVSGSWGEEDDIKAGEAAVALMAEFDKRNEIQLNILYFANKLYSSRAEVDTSGTFAWNQIIQNIKATKARNVVLMTDDDMDYQAREGGTCVVDGHVWFLWKNKKSRCQDIVDHLKGKQGSSEYSIQ